MAKVTGKRSRINGIVCHGYWELETRVLEHPVWCSDTCGGPVLVDFTQDWTAKAMVWGHTPATYPGSTFKFEGMDSNDAGWTSDADGAIVEEFELNVPAYPAQPMWYELLIGGDGQIQTSAALTADALSIPDEIVSGLGRAVELDGVAVTGCVGSKLKITNMVVPFGDSDVAGWVQRMAGNFNAGLVYRVNLDGISNVPAVNTDFQVSLPVTGSTSWDVDWMRVLSRRPVYDHGTRDGKAKIVGMDVVMGWNSVVSGSRGSITAPDGTVLWPDDECSSSGAT